MSRPRFGEPKTATSPSILNKIPLSQGVACGGYHTCVVTGLQGGHHLPSEVSFWPENHSVQKEDCLGEYFPLPGLWKDGDRCTSDDKAIPVKHFFDEGELYTWGSNENGCLGLGGIDAFHSPQKVESSSLKFPVSEVSCGWKHTAAISGGCVFTWGWGGSHGTFSIDGHSSGGQLGHGDDVDYFEPNMVNLGKNLRALQISCGFNHTGAIFEFTDACG